MDVGVVPIAEKDLEGKVNRRQLEVDLSAILVLPDITFNRHILFRMKQSGRRKSDRSGRLMTLLKNCHYKRYCAAIL